MRGGRFTRRLVAGSWSIVAGAGPGRSGTRCPEWTFRMVRIERSKTLVLLVILALDVVDFLSIL